MEGAKSASGRLARTDESLLGRRSTKPIHVIVKLDYDPLAAYAGQISGLPATSPAVTGKGLNLKSDAARRYEGFVRGVEQRFRDSLQARIPDASARAWLRVAYGGVALTLPSNQVAELLKLPGVVAVQRDRLEQPLTDSSPDFIGAPTIYGQLGQTAADAGKGVIVGVLDTGSWPEHPSYVDHGNLPAPPPKADGTPRTCNFGDNPLTPANDPFVCQHKLISGQPFLDTYNAVLGDEPYPTSARDSDGHGTHTSTTAAGGPVAHANPLGIDRGAIHGIAPGAYVAVYKVCGTQGCFASDSTEAVGQAILDGVRAINFSISGGTDPYTDAVELAFLDAYAAGIVVSTSAGNDGPGAATVNHNSPWVLSVAASTQTRTFRSTISLSGGGASLQVSGATITSGITSPLPVVKGSDPPYSNVGCDAPAPPGMFTGKIVACERGPNRVLRGFNVFQGGAAGMILYNAQPLDVMTDNHWLPTVHIDQPESQQLLNFLAAYPGATASFPQGTKTSWQGDRVAYFSSRGPGSDWVKPDISAPGLQILAGNTPTPNPAEPVLGPPGNLFQAIAGTSMSSPHLAGSAALVAALHPSWSAGQIKSALETTAKTAGVTKEDGSTPADPFDVGGGRVDLTNAGDPGLTFDETAADYAAGAATPLDRIDLNTPSVNAPSLPGVISTTRTATNVTANTLAYRVSTASPAGTSISVNPSQFAIQSGGQITLNITISAASAPQGQYFGRIDLDQQNGPRDLHLPVAFFKRQGVVTLSQSCNPSTIKVNVDRSTCDVTVQNNSLSPADVSTVSTTSQNLAVTQATGATKVNDHKVTASATLAGRKPDAPAIAPGSLFGYMPLDAFGVTPIAIGDEEALNFNVPAFIFAGQTFTQLGVVSDGYLVAGGATGQDVNFVPQTLPDPARPNGVLAPFWTDLDGTGAPGIFVATLTDGVSDWLVIESRLNIFGTTSQRVFQAWIGLNGTEDITFAYDPVNLPAAPPAGFGLTVGAENSDGSAGDQIAPTSSETPPTEDLRVTSTPGAPGGSLSYSYELKGVFQGVGTARTDLTTPLVRGTTTDVDTITVTR
ncbi:MAG TPA: S8 family serine peptidase [Candidatus Polarisedimenticolia bacterium]|nr:S8 family serine peptidase [Candidatus Polarisedimenticolia bacterium]